MNHWLTIFVGRRQPPRELTAIEGMPIIGSICDAQHYLNNLIY
jgi:hypothetical protein